MLRGLPWGRNSVRRVVLMGKSYPGRWAHVVSLGHGNLVHIEYRESSPLAHTISTGLSIESAAARVTHSLLAMSGGHRDPPVEETRPTMAPAPAGSDRFSRSAPGDAQIESLRLPPHSVEAEQAVLGGLLLSNQSWDKIGDLIGESDFYRADH